MTCTMALWVSASCKYNPFFGGVSVQWRCTAQAGAAWVVSVNIARNGRWNQTRNVRTAGDAGANIGGTDVGIEAPDQARIVRRVEAAPDSADRIGL